MDKRPSLEDLLDYWYMEDFSDDSLLYNVKMLYGSPGEESLNCGRIYSTQTGELTHQGSDLQLNTSADPTARLDGLEKRETLLSSDRFGKKKNVPGEVWKGLEILDLPYADVPMDWLSSDFARNGSKTTETYSVDSMSEAARESSIEDTEWHPDKTTDASFSFSADSRKHRVSQTAMHTKKTRLRKTAVPERPFGIRKKRSSCTLVPVVANKVTQRNPKGVTMCLRTLLRQLLAGSGWIMDSSISKEKATSLIKILVGQDLNDQLAIDFPTDGIGEMSTAWKEDYYSNMLHQIMELYLARKVSRDNVGKFIARYPRKGPYRISHEFRALLGNQHWPPYLPHWTVMRTFGCYIEGEASLNRKPGGMKRNKRRD